MKPIRTLIVIPARYGSTRLPGKPLQLLCGKTMLHRVYQIASSLKSAYIDVVIATDDIRIAQHAIDIGAPYVMTPTDCRTGTDRTYQAIKAYAPAQAADLIINLQGDAPLTPPWFIENMICSFAENPTSIDVVTPVVQLNWEQLDLLRERKKTTPFSGTTAVVGKDGKAFWFSKNIIPALRKEDRTQPLSPVYQHIGLYGYRPDILEKCVDLSEGVYEKIEGLEQLRFLENGFHIQCVPVDLKGRPISSGVDSPEDILRVEQVILKYGELL